MPSGTRAGSLAVVGGGVIGLSVARRAAQDGWSVRVHRTGQPGASWVAGGMLAPHSEGWPGEEELLAIGLESLALWRADGMATERWNRLHPTEPARKSHVEQCLEGHDGPGIAATDYMRNYADQVREYVQAAGRRYTVLGTDGFGRSDYRRKLRRFFEVDRWHVVVAALKALADDGVIKPAVVAEAITKYGLDAERAAPWTV